MKNLSTYTVFYLPDSGYQTQPALSMRFEAEDAEHAREQFEDAKIDNETFLWAYRDDGGCESDFQI